MLCYCINPVEGWLGIILDTVVTFSNISGSLGLGDLTMYQLMTEDLNLRERDREGERERRMTNCDRLFKHTSDVSGVKKLATFLRRNKI